MRLTNMARRAFVTSVAGIFGLGLFAVGAPAHADHQYGKRDDDARELAVVADDDADDGPGDNTNTRGTTRDNTRNTNDRSRNTNDGTRSNFTRASRDQDISRGDVTRDWTRDGGGDRTRDFSRNLTNDRSRHDTR